MIRFLAALQNHTISRDEDGAGIVEYALLIAFVGILLIGALLAMKTGVADNLVDAPTWFDSTP